MDALLVKVGDWLLQQGALGILCIVLGLLLYRESTRNDKLMLELKELAKDGYGVLAVIKDKIK